MFAWEHCAKCKALVVGVWIFALGCLIFIGWGCSSDTGTTTVDGSVDANGLGTPDHGGSGGTVAVDQKPDTRGVVGDVGETATGGFRSDGGGTGDSLDSAGNSDQQLSRDGGGLGDMGTTDSGSAQPDSGQQDGFTPGLDMCGHENAPNYTACCPDGMDCKPLYGDRYFCSCSVQPMPYGFLKTCEPFQTINPKTTRYPTRCVGP